MAPKKLDIRNRIIEIKRMKLGDIAHNPRNWRTHPPEQRETFNGILKEIGFAGVPLAYNSERTGTLTYVDGHLRKETAPDLLADVAILDITDAEADLLLSLFDPLGDMAGTDDKQLDALLQEINTDNPALQRALADLADRAGIYDADDGLADDEETTEEGEGEKSDGSLLALVDVTIDEPHNLVEKGDVWWLGPHVLICAEVILGWPHWASFLTDPEKQLFCPFPGPFVPLSLKAEKYHLVLVQPDPYIAGHILDRYEEIHGNGSIKKDDPV